MSCFSPLVAWRSRKVNEGTGKRPLTFNFREGYADQRVDVPCGKCVGCRTDQSRMWGVRCYHEASLHERNCFLTLTYDDEHLPADGKIDVRHLQLFFKRVRRSYKLRYFACGEYGSQTRRPHYHAILFGVDFLGGAIDITDKMYTHPYLIKAWDKGHVSIGSFSTGAAMYVAGYATKKIADEDTFVVMSRRPGIGHDWLLKYGDDLCRTGSVVIEGQEYPIPKRYFDWYFDLEVVKLQQTEYMRNRSPEQVCRAREVLRSRQVNALAKIARVKEKL